MQKDERPHRPNRLDTKGGQVGDIRLTALHSFFKTQHHASHVEYGGPLYVGRKGTFWVVAVAVIVFRLKPMILPETYTVETVRPKTKLRLALGGYQLWSVAACGLTCWVWKPLKPYCQLFPKGLGSAFG